MAGSGDAPTEGDPGAVGVTGATGGFHAALPPSGTEWYGGGAPAPGGEGGP